jgi:hypothetical protein
MPNSGAKSLRMQLEVLLTFLDVLSQKLPGWTEANHEMHQLECPVFVASYEHWDSRIQSYTADPPVCYIYLVTLWGSSASVVTMPRGIRTLFPVRTRIFVVSTESRPALGPHRGVELTTIASITRVKNAWMYTSILAPSISSCGCV